MHKSNGSGDKERKTISLGIVDGRQRVVTSVVVVVVGGGGGGRPWWWWVIWYRVTGLVVSQSVRGRTGVYAGCNVKVIRVIERDF